MQPPPPAEVLEGEEEYEVDSIVDHRRVSSHNSRPRYEYLVRWTGHSAEHDTWEGEENLKNAPTVLKGYWEEVNKRATGRSRRTRAGKGRKRRRGDVD
jgi:hypothetical protein